MKALTIWPEWAWAIGHLSKDVENRTWKPSMAPGEWFAIHAGFYLGGRRGLPATEDAVSGLITMARRAGWMAHTLLSDELMMQFHHPAHGEHTIRTSDIPTGAIVAVARFDGVERRSDGWAVPGQMQWMLGSVRVLDCPLICRGAQGLWTVPPDLERLILKKPAVGVSR